jgi:hypothetical protein
LEALAHDNKALRLAMLIGMPSGYRVADALVLTLMEQGQIFDVSKTRIWLASKRKEEAIPAIDTHEALLVP